MKPFSQSIVLFTGVLFLFGACGSQKLNLDKPVLHLFSDLDLVEIEGALGYPEDGSPLRSRLTYPHQDTLWVQPWKGKQALRFESTEQGDLRGTLYTMHQKIEPSFHLSMNSWLEADTPETWSGIVFWMERNKHAVGVRWKAQKYKQQVQVQIFRYVFPHVKPLIQRSYSFTDSHWASIGLSVNGNEVQMEFEGNPALSCELQPEWRQGDTFGFFQGQGTGYFANLNIELSEKTLNFEKFFSEWNQQMVNTTGKVLLDLTPTPDDFVGNDELPVRRIAIADDWRISVPVHCPSQMTYRLSVPKDSVLHAGFGVLPAFALSKASAEFQVIARMKDEETILEAKTITPVKENLNSIRYHDWHIPLNEYSGQEIDLIFRVNRISGEEPLISCWSEPTIGIRSKSKKPNNVVLILLDTLRADRLGVYGNERGLTPYIDKFASEGTTFLQTVSQAPWTVPSHASFFTSLYPSETQCDNSGNTGNRLQESYLTWAEMLQREGYSTAGFTTGLAIRGDVLFCQGFDTYQDIMYDLNYSFETVYERFDQWLEERSGEPFFTFLHTYAIHFPYEHEQYVNYRVVPRNWDDQRLLDIDTYDSGVRYADEWVGSILRNLENRNLLDSTLVIIASDHGEELGERGMPRPAHHGHTLHDELLLVPMIFRLPGKVPQGKKVEKQVRLVDMLPTVLDITGYKKPAVSHGLSLMPLMNGQPEKLERYAFSEGMTYGIAQKSIRTKDYKYICIPDAGKKLDNTPTGIPVLKQEQIQLYDLIKDPGEKHNIAGTNPDKLKEMQRLYEYVQEISFNPDLFTDSLQVLEPPSISPRVMEGMQAGGYFAK